MLTLLAAALAFFALHRIVSGSPLRHRLVAVVGESVFRGLFALASVFCLIWLWTGFLEARASAYNLQLFAPTPAVRWLQIPLQLLALAFIVAGLTTRNPTIAGMGASVHDQDVLHGMLRITRHPFLWGISIFSAGHMLVLGDLAAWTFFGTLLVLALTGTVSIDSKRRRAFGKDWAGFAASTSNLPFAAILKGRQPLKLLEIGWWRFLITVAVFVLLTFVHPYLFGLAAQP